MMISGDTDDTRDSCCTTDELTAWADVLGLGAWEASPEAEGSSCTTRELTAWSDVLGLGSREASPETRVSCCKTGELTAWADDLKPEEAKRSPDTGACCNFVARLETSSIVSEGMREFNDGNTVVALLRRTRGPSLTAEATGVELGATDIKVGGETEGIVADAMLAGDS
jgi:hypothetical protein